jgi:hypothetical protein
MSKRYLPSFLACWPLYVGLGALAVLAACNRLASWRDPPPGWQPPSTAPTYPAPSPTPKPGPGPDSHPWQVIEPAVGALAPFIPPPWDVIVTGAAGIVGGVLYGRRRREEHAGGGAK